MNITFLIGNGFDLNLGLRTKYEHFLECYTRLDYRDTEAINSMKEHILQNWKLWSDAEKAFGDYTADFKEHGFTAEEFDECYYDFCEKLAMYLQREERRLNYNKIIDAFAGKFAKAIRNYIGNGFTEVQTAELQNSIRPVSGGESYNFINFNYTETVDNFVNKLTGGILGQRRLTHGFADNSFGVLYHVHGTTKADMVFGVNDETQIKCKELFDGHDEEIVNQLIKIKANEMNEQNMDSKVHAVLKNSNLIYIYGMSIGATDALWWKRIAEIMKSNPNLHVIINYFGEDTTRLISGRERRFENSQRKQFTKYCELSEEDKNKIEKRIHIDRRNIFSELKDLVDNDLDKSDIIELEFVDTRDTIPLTELQKALNSEAFKETQKIAQNMNLKNALEMASKIKIK